MTRRPACVARTGVPRPASQLPAGGAHQSFGALRPRSRLHLCRRGSAPSRGPGARPGTTLSRLCAPRGRQRPGAPQEEVRGAARLVPREAGAQRARSPAPLVSRAAPVALPCAQGRPESSYPQRVQPDPSSSSAASTCAGSAPRSRSLRSGGKKLQRPLDIPSPGRTPATSPSPQGTSRAPRNSERALLRRLGPVPSRCPESSLRRSVNLRQGCLHPHAAAKQSLGSVIPTAFLASAGEQPGGITNTRASSSTTPGSAPGPVPFPRRSDNPELRVWVRGRPTKQEGEAMGSAGAPRVGSSSSRRLPALSGVEAGWRLKPLPARPAASRRAPGSAPRPGRRSAGNPSDHYGAVS